MCLVRLGYVCKNATGLQPGLNNWVSPPDSRTAASASPTSARRRPLHAFARSDVKHQVAAAMAGSQVCLTQKPAYAVWKMEGAQMSPLTMLRDALGNEVDVKEEDVNWWAAAAEAG